MKRSVKDTKIVRPDKEESSEEISEPEEPETTKFEETGDGIEKIPEPEPEEPEIIEELVEYTEIERLKEDILREVLEVNEITGADYKADMEILQDRLKEILEIVEEKDKTIEILSTKNIDLINIDMELISDELYESEIRLNNIATIPQFERLNELENTKGINMAYKVSKLYLEHAGTEARLAIPTLNLIKISLEKISEKLRYVGDEDV